MRCAGALHDISAAAVAGTMHGVIPAGHANNTAPVVPGQYLASAMVVSRRQQGNPVLKHLKHVRWQFGDIVPDYLLGASSCALFLSLRFHALHPDYLSQRIRELQMAFRLRIVLCHLDTEDPARPLHAIMKACSAARCALVCAWSPQECARYLETFKAYEHRPADAILGRIERDYHARLSAALTSVRGVNRSDVISMGTTLGSLSAVLRAPRDALEGCAGIGPTKARRLFAAFHEPFRKKQRGGVAAQKPPEKRVPEYVAWNSRGGSDRAAGDMAQTGSGAGEGQAEGRDNEDAAGDDRNEGDEGGAAADGEGTGLSGHRALADVDAAFLGVGGEAFEGQEGGESGGED